MSASDRISQASRQATRALELEKQGRIAEAVECWTPAIELLMGVASGEKDPQRRAALGERVEQYLAHTETLKAKVRREDALMRPGQTRQRHERTIEIAENQTGCSYPVIFRAYISTAKKAVISDAYIRKPHQLYNLTRFCEMCAHNNVEALELVTGQPDDASQQREQREWLEELKESLKSAKISFSYSFDATLHDRQIAFDNGWVVKIGRGLDYFKRPSGRFVLGASDYDLRPCLATTIDVYFQY
eukprot:m.304371 g.304371  ORF g.304371 m.304371 type:complete len:245 (-) comp16822_c0_seq1:922-1656(-)